MDHHSHAHPHPHPHVHDRRGFLKHVALGSLALAFGEGCGGLSSPERSTGAYDLLIAGGRVIDPSQGLSGPSDVAIKGHTVARVAPLIARSEATKVLDASGRIVTPGLIDVHVHVYEGVAPL